VPSTNLQTKKNMPPQAEFDKEAYKVNQVILGALALTCIAGSGEALK